MATPPAPVRLGLIGAGRIGTSHARVIAERVPGAVLAAVADARPGVAADQPRRARGWTPRERRPHRCPARR